MGVGYEGAGVIVFLQLRGKIIYPSKYSKFIKLFE